MLYPRRYSVLSAGKRSGDASVKQQTLYWSSISCLPQPQRPPSSRRPFFSKSPHDGHPQTLIRAYRGPNSRLPGVRSRSSTSSSSDKWSLQHPTTKQGGLDSDPCCQKHGTIAIALQFSTTQLKRTVPGLCLQDILKAQNKLLELQMMTPEAGCS